MIDCLSQTPFLLVSTLGQPAGVIVRDDVEKPPMRMWLFGMVTLLELSITSIIDQFYPDDSWITLISSSRLELARALQKERVRRNHQVRLIDCLQLGDKGQIIAKSAEIREKHWNKPRRRIEKNIQRLQTLRNHLAHSQPLVDENWESIVQVSSTLDRMLETPEDLFAPSSLNPYPESRERSQDSPEKPLESDG